MNALSWSFSSYSTAMQCLYKHRRIYIEGLPSPDNFDFAFGSAIHSAIRVAVEQTDDAEAIFDIYWATYEKAPYPRSRYSWSELRVIGKDIIRKFVKSWAKRYVPQIVEVRAYSEYKGIKLEGTLDFAGTFDGVPSLVDWKTSSYPYDKDKTLIALQLYLYAYLAIKEFGFTPTQIIYAPFIKSAGSIQTPLVLPFREEDMYRHLDGMLSYIAKLTATPDAPKNPNSCLMGKMKCPFFDHCWGKS
jgi:hypothetical protein